MPDETMHIDWEIVQEKVRRYAKQRGYEVSPEEYLSPEDSARGLGLQLYTEYSGGVLPALKCVATREERDEELGEWTWFDYARNAGVDALLSYLRVVEKSRNR